MDFQHRTPGNLRAFVQATLRNIISGIQCDTRFSSTEDIEVADVFTQPGTFLYQDGDSYYFMLSDTYEQIQLSEELIGGYKQFLQDGMEVKISTFEGQPIGVVLPKTVVMTITDTPPEMKGATATNAPKPATTDSGFQLSVPNFVTVGAKIIVDTESGEYLGRSTG